MPQLWYKIHVHYIFEESEVIIMRVVRFEIVSEYSMMTSVSAL